MGEKKDDKKKEEPIRIIGDKTKENHFVIYSGKEYQVLFPGVIPLIDAHMHIQSNNCAPLTLQWGQLLNLIAGKLSALSEKKREEIIKNTGNKSRAILNAIDMLSSKILDNVYFNTNSISRLMAIQADRETLSALMSFITFIVKDFGIIGKQPTDVIAHLFMRNLTRMKEAMKAYKMLSVNEMEKVYKARYSTDDTKKGENKPDKEFAVQTSYYYRNILSHHLNIVMPMDMSFAHYWGNYGIPVYLPVGIDSYYFINDYLFSISIIDILKQNYWSLEEKIKEFEYKFKIRIPELNEKIKGEIKGAKERVITYFDKMMEDLKIKKTEISRQLDDLIRRLESGYQTIKRNTDEMLDKTGKVITKYDEMQKEYIRHIEEEMEKAIKDEIIKYENYKKTENKWTLMFIDDYIQYKIEEIIRRIIERDSSDVNKTHDEVDVKLENAKKEFRKALDELEDAAVSKTKKAADEIENAAVSEAKKASNELKAARKRVITRLEGTTGKIKEEVKNIIDGFLKKVDEIKTTVKKTIKEIQTDMKIYAEGGKVIPYDIDLNGSQEFFILDDPVSIDINKDPEKIKKQYSKKDYEDRYLKKKYNHFLEIAPGEKRNTYTFEDYIMQRDNTLGAALKYPFEYLAFNNIEPRRYYDGDNPKYLKDLMDNINKNHGFFINERTDSHKIKLTPVEFTDRYMNEEMFGSKNKTKTKDMYQLLHPDGVFVGVKMYTELGYPPTLFNQNSNRVSKHFQNQMKDQYKHLKDIFKECIKRKIPITCHGSPGGMTIADTYIYHRESKKLAGEANKKFFDSLYGISSEVFIESIRHVDEQFVSPAAWKEVLDDAELGELRICLAHFSGFESWKEKTHFDWREDLSKLIKSKSHVYTDISCYVQEMGGIPDTMYDKEMDKIKGKIKNPRDINVILDAYLTHSPWLGYAGIRNWKPETSKNKYKLKPDLDQSQLSSVRTILRTAGIIEDDIEKIGDNLCGFLNGQYGEALKKKVMMGSDWHMTERNIIGVDDYYGRMFDLLKYVTKKMNKYDVWHQFSVINPMRFVGFLKDDDQTIDMDKVKKHKENIEKFLKRTDINETEWRKVYKVSKQERDNILSDKPIAGSLKLQEYYFKEYEKMKIKASDKIKDKDDKFVILKDWNNK